MSDLILILFFSVKGKLCRFDQMSHFFFFFFFFFFFLFLSDLGHTLKEIISQTDLYMCLVSLSSKTYIYVFEDKMTEY